MDIADRTRPTGSLPTPLTSMIGREREITEVVALACDPDVRLVTLTGPGGVGKTRLAVKVARQVIDAFPDGIRFIDLSALTDAGLVASTIAQRLGVGSSADPLPALMAILSSQHGLLLLDNFEQVVEAAPVIAQVLASAPHLTVLVTSREPLRIGGEHEYPLAPLSVSGAADAPDAPNEAVRLFAERAQAVLPSFALTPGNIADVAEICRRLDGLPLAIELAAARVKALPVSVLRDRLEQRLAMLVGARRDAPARQQTMRDTIVWSYSLLTDPEQAMFRRLGVFVGGFTLEVAEAIGSVGSTDVDVLRTLSSLVDKSLIRLDPAAVGGPRYLMLETIREYAHEQLLASAECAEVRNAHAAWFSRLAEQRRVHGDIWNEPKSSGHTLPPVEVDYGNVRAAIAWLDESGNLAEMARMAGSVYWYWHVNGPRREGLNLLRRASQVSVETPRDKESRMWATEGLSIFARNAGYLDEATDAALELQALAQELGDIIGESLALGFLGYIALAQGNYERTDSLVRRAIEKREQSGEGWAVALVLVHLGLAALGQGNLTAARDYFEQVLASDLPPGYVLDIATTHGYLALLNCEEGAYGEAATSLAEALTIWQELNNQENTSEWLAQVAVLGNATGNHEASVRFLAAGIGLRDVVGHAFVLPERIWYERAEQSLRTALSSEDYARAWKAGAALTVKEALSDAAEFLARVHSSASKPGLRHEPTRFGLTPRELDVLRLLAQGKPDREIAEALFVGTRTVETHVSNLIAKLAVHNRTEAAARAMQTGLVDGRR